MFTIQMADATSKLLQAGMPQEQIDALMGVLGNCQQVLVHRGPVAIGAEFPDSVVSPTDIVDTEFVNTDTGMESKPDLILGNSYPPAAATFVNKNSYVDVNNVVRGGFAAAFHGPVWFGGRIVANGSVGIDASVTVVTSADYTSDSLVFTRSVLTFKKGILTEVTTTTDETIPGEPCP